MTSIWTLNRAQHLRRKDIAYRQALVVDVGMRRVERDTTAVLDTVTDEEGHSR